MPKLLDKTPKITDQTRSGAIIAVEKVLKSNYEKCARDGQFIKPIVDEKLSSQIHAALQAGANPNSRIELRSGVQGSLLCACLILGAWKSAETLILAGSDLNDPLSGKLGSIPPLFFCVRIGIQEAKALSALMIERGANPNAGAPDSFSFDFDYGYVDTNFGQTASKRGSMFRWMAFHDNRPAMIAAANAKASAKTCCPKLEAELRKLDFYNPEPGKLTAEVEAAVLESFKKPATTDAQAAKPRRL